LVRKQAAGLLADHRRVQRCALVGRVDRLDAAMSLEVEQPAGGDVRGHVGDGIPHPVPVPRPLEVQRLVEVHRADRVDGDERHLGLVAIRQHDVARGALRLGLDVGREVARHLQLLADRREPGHERPVVDLGMRGDRGRRAEPDLALRHGRHHRTRLRITLPAQGAAEE